MQFKIMGYNKDYKDLKAEWIEADNDHRKAIEIYMKRHPKAVKAYLYGIEGLGFEDDQPPKSSS